MTYTLNYRVNATYKWFHAWLLHYCAGRLEIGIEYSIVAIAIKKRCQNERHFRNIVIHFAYDRPTGASIETVNGMKTLEFRFHSFN